MEGLWVRVRSLSLERGLSSARLSGPPSLLASRCRGPCHVMPVAFRSRFSWNRISWDDPEVTVFKQTADDGIMRLDRLLREQTGFPQSVIQQIVNSRKVQAVRNGVILSKDETHVRLRVLPGDQVAVFGLRGMARDRSSQDHDEEKTEYKPQSRSRVPKMSFDVLYKDDHLLAIQKPSGLVVQGGDGVESAVLTNYLDELKFEKSEPPRIVHRLDKLTTGVLLLGRTRAGAIKLSEMFRNSTMTKEYIAQVAGWPRKNEGTIDTPLCVEGEPPLEKIVLANEQTENKWSAVTKYQVLDQREDVHGRPVSCVRLWPQTGRKHQLRAHCALVLRSPIVGDRKYGYVVLGPMKVSRKGIVPIMNLHLHLNRITLPAGWLDPEANLPPTPTIITAPAPLYLNHVESMVIKADKAAAETIKDKAPQTTTNQPTTDTTVET
ncbi:pseudouridine synthase [Syncephalis fuscata]|nr:pseudouridine synthase [Syncephalis fuscata]